MHGRRDDPIEIAMATISQSKTAKVEVIPKLRRLREALSRRLRRASAFAQHGAAHLPEPAVLVIWSFRSLAVAAGRSVPTRHLHEACLHCAVRAVWKKIRYRLEWLALKSVAKIVPLLSRKACYRLAQFTARWPPPLIGRAAAWR